MIRTVASKATWIITGVVCALQIGLSFRDWWNGSITGRDFWISAGKSLVSGLTSVAGSAAGATAGAAIGALVGPAGAIIGIFIGGAIGGFLASWGGEKLY